MNNIWSVCKLFRSWGVYSRATFFFFSFFSFWERDVTPWWSVRSWYGGSSDRSLMVDPLRDISNSSQCSITDVTKAVVCAILSVRECI